MFITASGGQGTGHVVLNNILCTLSIYHSLLSCHFSV